MSAWPPVPHQVRTTFVGGINPFKLKASTMATRKPAAAVDLAKLRIADDPLPQGRLSGRNKYAEVFRKLKLGQCIVCDKDDADRIAAGLRKWMADEKIVGLVKLTRDYGDGKGRVWMLAKPGAEPAAPQPATSKSVRRA